jgi:hypothetical protein
MAAACSSETAPEHNRQRDQVETGPKVAAADTAAADTAAGNTAAANTAAEVVPAPAAAGLSAVSGKGVRRCGWLHNPTPANWWLTDSEDQWILGTQGADQAPGMDELPDMSTAGWVETNGHYGYGCACMTITADGEGKVTRIADAQPKPLKQCRADRKLPRPE